MSNENPRPFKVYNTYTDATCDGHAGEPLEGDDALAGRNSGSEPVFRVYNGPEETCWDRYFAAKGEH